jgi:hypothetical protein
MTDYPVLVPISQVLRLMPKMAFEENLRTGGITRQPAATFRINT